MFTLVSRSVRQAAAVAAVLAASAVLAVTATKAAPISSSAPDPAQAGHADKAPLIQQAAGEGSGLFPLITRDKNGRLFDYEPKGTGGFAARFDLGGGYADATALTQANISANLTGTDLYAVIDGMLYYTAERGNDTKVLGGGWDAYNLLVSVDNMGGTAHPDLLARDKDGALWLYQGKADGTLAARVRAGTGGWNGMDELTGRGDYTGDGKADLVARSTTGTLYLYPGTGNATADAVVGTRVTVAAPSGTAWKDYTALVSVGDNDGDGKSDLIGVDSAGALWLFKGTGKSSAPFAARTQIGTGGWTAYNLLF
ncbi:VCBS repeat-containing protein [Streptomyces yaanensis]|uniref:VCBS repeat-containing protein n=1 Tax=Streptomyces yaanensis TaxID=1142239 RepID=A0ABV7SEX0_9ACTN|nr:VCBS repeat-containing protein [Streptomyces sp. CGMCC 4.7035]WNB97858.1 VCBS repeat-containing protein [Streptomyces sp. CGMCC 4.7035]